MKVFNTPREMYDFLVSGIDLYNAEIETYVFVYNEEGSLATYHIPLSRACQLQRETVDADDYWGSCLGIGGYIHDGTDAIELCESLYSEYGWCEIVSPEIDTYLAQYVANSHLFIENVEFIGTCTPISPAPVITCGSNSVSVPAPVKTAYDVFVRYWNDGSIEFDLVAQDEGDEWADELILTSVSDNAISIKGFGDFHLDNYAIAGVEFGGDSDTFFVTTKGHKTIATKCEAMQRVNDFGNIDALAVTIYLA